MNRAGVPTRQVIVLCLCAVGLALVAGIAVGSADTTDDPLDILAQEDIDADTVVMVADLRDDGSAQWRVEYRLELDDEQEEQAFEDLQDDIEADSSAYLDPFADRMERTVANAEESTGREMTASGFEIHTDRQPQPDTEFGIVTFQFEWDGFAAVEDEGETIRAGDAIDRLFLEEGVNLQISWPDAFGQTQVEPDPTVTDDQRVIWRGPLDFDAGQPRIVLSSADGVDDTDDDTAVDPAEGEGILSPIMLLVIVAAAVLVGAAGFLLRSRNIDDRDEGGEESDVGGTSEGPPPELLSNEERLLTLLEQNGGRMKQQEVVEQLDWTAAKTSQVVGDLREDDQIESFRLGRENVLTLPDVDIEGNDSSE